MCTTNNHFVIVIDVDNKRAYKAYSKGMQDLMDVWPQLMVAGEKAEQEYAQASVVYQQKATEIREKEKKEREERKAKQEAYNQEYKRWLSSSPLFRGDEPKDPYPWPFVGSSMFDLEAQIHRVTKPRMGMGTQFYKSIRDELQKMLNLAGAAAGPYRMMESQVHTMIEWENGTRVQQLLDAIKEN